MDAGNEEHLPPFFNTTFSTHRVSPLYIGRPGLTTARLDTLAHRLRDTLVGDVVRGIQVGLEAADTPTGQVGPLRAVTIQWFRPQSVLGEASSQDHVQGGAEDGRQLSEEQERGLWIEIRHENAVYVALLLPVSSSDGRGTADVDKAQFVHLPLLLLRMPQSLKSVIGEWLSTTFDCRVSKLNLGTKTLVKVWEGWISTAGLPNKGPDFVLTVCFNVPRRDGLSSPTPDSDLEADESNDSVEAGLWALEIAISPSDLGRFLRAGQAEGPHGRAAAASWDTDPRERRRLAGGKADDGWAWRAGEEPPKQPFTEALGRYLDHHLALKLFHPGVRVVQISCGAFVLAQSRLKIVKLGDVTGHLARAAWMFMTQLGARIRDDALLLMS